MATDNTNPAKIIISSHAWKRGKERRLNIGLASMIAAQAIDQLRNLDLPKGARVAIRHKRYPVVPVVAHDHGDVFVVATVLRKEQRPAPQTLILNV